MPKVKMHAQGKKKNTHTCEDPKLSPLADLLGSAQARCED